jgi:uncharacterized protein (TIGR02246 family)
MKKLRIAVLALAAPIFAAAPLRSAGARRPALDPAIMKVEDAFVAAVLRGDAAAVARLYLEDGVELPNCAPRAAGRGAVEAYYRRFFEGPGRITAFTVDPLDMQVAGDLAYVTGVSRHTISRGPSLPPLEIPGKYLVLLRKDGGAWKVAYAIYNGDQPMPGAP